MPGHHLSRYCDMALLHLPVSPDSELLKEGAMSGAMGARPLAREWHLASQTPKPSSLIFPNKRHGVTPTRSLYPGKVHDTD